MTAICLLCGTDIYFLDQTFTSNERLYIVVENLSRGWYVSRCICMLIWVIGNSDLDIICYLVLGFFMNL